MASSTTSTAGSTSAFSNYDIFINHHGQDVRKTIASHLYRSLHSDGLKVFLDQFELQRGDCLTPQIEGVIRSASVHVAIFSVGYAESVWCLKELVLMLESKAPIIPVFYHVKPSELRQMRGKDGGFVRVPLKLRWTRGKDDGYTRALRKLEKKKRYDPQTIESWRTALSSVADMSGFELEACDGDEGVLVDRVVKRVFEMVKKPAFDVATYRIGLAEKLNEFEDIVLLQRQDRCKPQIFGIVGLGGVGKTTLAKEFFNRKISNYSTSCFLPDVRDNADKGSLNSLQRKLLKSLTRSDNPLNSVDEGRGLIRKHLSSANALVILDDVDNVDQVYALLPDQTVLHSDSLVVITSRNKDVLKSSGVEESALYNLTGLATQHSLELFCLHAFNNPHPLPEFESLVEKCLEACDGLPLSLKVLGALLNGENTFFWEDQLDKLQRILPSDINQTLQISYYALDEDEQHIFLDIACFFTGEDKDTAIRIWIGSGWNGFCGFQNIQNKCLVEVDIENKIKMHDNLRDLGREIAKDSHLSRRLWRWTENSIDDLLQQSSVIPVRGIRMHLSDYKDIDDDDAFGRIEMKRLELLDTEHVLLERILTKVQSPNLIWLCWKECAYSSLPYWIPMKNLRVLQVFGTKLETLWEDDLQVPSQLLQLEIDAPLSIIPKSIGQLKHLQRIVVGDSCEVSLTELPEEFCLLRSLEALVFGKCKQMKSLPECFGNLTNLRHIELCHFEALERLPDSFGNLTKLKYIDLSMCNKLEKLPDSFGNLTNLQYINMSECNKLQELPDSFGNLTNLQFIDLSKYNNLEKLPDSFGNLTNLQHINMADCYKLEMLPNSFGNLTNLQYMDLSTCNKLEKLPDSFGNLTNLQYIDLYDCPCAKLEVLPDSFVNLTNLRHITLSSLDDPANAGMCPAAVGLNFDSRTRSPCPCNPFPCNPSYSGGHSVRFRAGVPQKILFYKKDGGFTSFITNTRLDDMTSSQSLRDIFVQSSEMWTSRDTVYVFFTLSGETLDAFCGSTSTV